MKKLIVVFLLIVIILAGLPFLNGVLLERVIKKSVADMNSRNANNPFGYSVEIVKYDRGYLNSNIELKMDLGTLKDVYGIETVVVTVHAKHGLLGAASTSTLEDNAWYSAFIKDQLAGKDPLHIQTYYSLLDGIKSDIVLDGFSIATQKKNLNVKPAKLEVKSDRNLTKFNVSGNWQGLEIPLKASVGEISIAAKMEKVTGVIWKGNADLNLDNVNVNEKNVDFKLSGLKMHYVTNADKKANTISFDEKFNINNIKVKDDNISDVSVRVALAGMKLDAFKEFRDAYLAASSQMMSKFPIKDRAKMDPQAMKMEMAQMGLNMAAAYEKLLKKNFEIRISDVHAKLPQGDINGNIDIKLLKDMNFAFFMPLLRQPQSLLTLLYLKTDISLPASLVGDRPQLTQPVLPGMETGLFVKKGDYLVSNIETRNGKLYLNNNIVPLDKLIRRGGAPQPAYQSAL